MKFAIAALLGLVSAAQLFEATDSNVSHPNTQNPFTGKTIYPNPTFTQNVVNTETGHDDIKAKLEKVKDVGAATWIDKMDAISLIEPILQGAQKSGQLPMFVIYDLPNRDCAAKASNGEIHCEDNTCAKGLETYKTQYVDKVIAEFAKYPDVPIVAIVEPDSLPNIATNMAMPKCASSATAYKTGVEYTLKKLYDLGNVVSYLDAAHGGWLGWESNLGPMAQVFSEVLRNAGGNQVIRGFATNTANYQPLGSMSNTNDPCNLKSQSNNAIDEIHFIHIFDQHMSSAGISGMHYVTDTSRNGQTNERQDCANWCNIKGAGLGRRPTTDVSDLGLSNLDALVWIKTPGESDGTTDSSSPRHDPTCNSGDSFVPAPEAGQWHKDFFVMLTENANPPIDGSGGNCPGGSLTACMGQCPTSPASAYQQCVSDCAKNC